MKYDYSLLKIDFSNKLPYGKDKIRVICSKHGIFKVSYYAHRRIKSGCPKCIGRSKNINEHINEWNILHSNKYDYSKVNFKIKTDTIIITCPLHGDFKQVVQNHSSGKGCSKCSNVYRKTTKDFIEKSKAIYGSNKYVYNKTIYKNTYTHVSIKCKKHGLFSQHPVSHLKGCDGCKECRKKPSKWTDKAIILDAKKYTNPIKWKNSSPLPYRLAGERNLRELCYKHMNRPKAWNKK